MFKIKCKHCKSENVEELPLEPGERRYNFSIYKCKDCNREFYIHVDD